MGAGDIPNVEGAPQLIDTSDADVLARADELLQKYSKQETAALDRREKGLRITLIDGALENVTAKITAEQVKDPNNQDSDKLSRLVERKVALEKTRAAIMAVPDAKSDAKIAEVDATLKATATEMEGRLGKIEQTKARMAVVQGEIDLHIDAPDAEGQLKYAAALKEMGKLKKTLAALEKEGSQEDQKARYEAVQAERRKAAEMVKADHEEEVKIAEKTLDAFEAPEAEQPPTEATTEDDSADEEADESKDKDKSTSSEDPEAASARKKELLHNTLHKAAFGMAVVLEKDYPGEDGNAYEKTVWSGKAFLLKVLVMFGGTPKWAELLTPKQTEFLEKKVGIQFVEEDVKKDGVATSEKRLVAKFIKPIEGWEPGIVQMVDVFESAYGKDGAAKAMEGIKPETTLAELEATAATDTSENGEKTRKLVAAMKEADAKGETKVQEFLTNTQNAKKVQEILEPVEETTGAEAPREPSQLLKDLDAIPPASPEAIREHVVKDLLPALTDSTLTFTADMPLIDAWAAMLKPAGLTPEKEAKWAEDLALLKGMASGEGTYISKDMLEKVKDDPDIGKLLATILVATDAMSAEEAHIIIQDAADGSLDESSMASLAKSTDKMLTNLAQALDGKTLGQALEEFKPKNEDEKKKLEAAKQRISGEGKGGEVANNSEATPPTNELVIDQTSFELKTDEASTKALAEQGIKFTGKFMVDADDGNVLRDFGDAKTVEIKSLENNMFTLTATTPSTVIDGRPSGVKVETSTFTGMDSLVRPKEESKT